MPKQTRGTAICSVDGCEKVNDAPKGLCGEHYRRLRNYGTFERLRRPKGKSTCTVEGCDLPDDAGRGLCRLHYMRHRNHGHTGLEREGGKRSHPLYSIWFERRKRGSLCAEWAVSVLALADVVGKRPSQTHLLRRPDPTRPYGPDNWEWMDALRQAPNETRKEFTARKWASRREREPEYEARRWLNRKYGITTEDYEALYEAQKGVCAICRLPETSVHHHTMTPKALAVDHCHATKKVRGLLCFRCNSTVGRINEDLGLLDAIRDYLTEHAGA